MKKEPEEGTFPKGWADADEDAMFDAVYAFTQSNRCNIRTAKPDAIAHNSFIEGFIAGYEYTSLAKTSQSTTP